MPSELRCSFRSLYIDDLIQILRLWDIETMEVNGRKTPLKRAQTMKEFRESETSAVLMVSSVATAGLNLDCANILIIVVCLFFTFHHCNREADKCIRIYYGPIRMSNN